MKPFSEGERPGQRKSAALWEEGKQPEGRRLGGSKGKPASAQPESGGKRRVWTIFPNGNRQTAGLDDFPERKTGAAGTGESSFSKERPVSFAVTVKTAALWEEGKQPESRRLGGFKGKPASAHPETAENGQPRKTQGAGRLSSNDGSRSRSERSTRWNHGNHSEIFTQRRSHAGGVQHRPAGKPD